MASNPLAAVARAQQSAISRAFRAWRARDLESLAALSLAAGVLDEPELNALLDDRVGEALLAAWLIVLARAQSRADLPVTPLPMQARALVAEALVDLRRVAVEVLAPVVAQAVANGWAPLKTARALRRVIALTPAQVAQVERAREKAAARPRPTPTNPNPRRPTLAEADRRAETLRGKLERRRAMTVARQEMWRATQGAQQIAWEAAADAGVVARAQIRKHWNTRADRHVRDSHAPLPRAYPAGIGLDEAFVTSRGLLRYPLDPRGSAADTVGCRCWLTYEVVGR